MISPVEIGIFAGAGLGTSASAIITHWHARILNLPSSIKQMDTAQLHIEAGHLPFILLNTIVGGILGGLIGLASQVLPNTFR